MLNRGFPDQEDEMKKYSVFQAPLYAFFSKDFYADIGRNHRGTAFGYLFLLLLVCWVPVVMTWHGPFAEAVDSYAPGLIERIPEMTITDGRAVIHADQPCFIPMPHSTNTLAIFDTTGKYTSLEGQDAFVLVTETKVIMKQSAVETRSYSFAEIKNFALTREKMTNWVALGRKWIMPSVYAAVLISSFIGKVIKMLIYALIGLLFAKSAVPYASVLRLSVMAGTPAIVLHTVFMLTPIGFFIPGIAWFVLTLVYLYIGVRATTAAETPAPTSV